MVPLPRERFSTKFKINYETGCYEWQAGRIRGYGAFWLDNRNYFAHRVAWELKYNDGLLRSDDEIDHLCRNPSCVNVNHLQRVPKGFNSLQGGETTKEIYNNSTHCYKGIHKITDSNSKRLPSGWRSCILCRRDRNRKRQEDPEYRERRRLYWRDYRIKRSSAA